MLPILDTLYENPIIIKIAYLLHFNIYKNMQTYIESRTTFFCLSYKNNFKFCNIYNFSSVNL